MSQRFLSALFNRRVFATRSFVVLVVTLTILVALVPGALAFTFSQFQTPTGQADPTVITMGSR